MAVETRLTGDSPYGAPPSLQPGDALFNIVDLASNAVPVLRYLDGLDRPATQH